MMSNVVPIPDDYQFAAIPPQMLHLVWDECVCHIERVVDVAHGDITLTSTRNRLVSGDLQLYTITRHGEIIAVFCTDVHEHESGLRSLRVPIIGGEEIDMWLDQAVQIWRQLAKEMMCDRALGMGRPGWERKMRKHGLKKTHVTYELDIED